jgi:hypothetical protein
LEAADSDFPLTTPNRPLGRRTSRCLKLLMACKTLEGIEQKGIEQK